MTSRRCLGFFLMVAGTLILIFGLPKSKGSVSAWHIEKQRELRVDTSEFPALATHFPVEKLQIYRIGDSDTARYASVAQFRNGTNRPETAILSIRESLSVDPGEGDRRYAVWIEAAAVLRKHAKPSALIVSWWDNAQRIRLLTGLDTWLRKPVAAGFPHTAQRKLWDRLGGGYDDDDKLRRLAQWYMGVTSFEPITKRLPCDRPIYVVVTVDDFAHLDEMQTLAQSKVNFRSTQFPLSGDIHGVVRRVKQWAQAQGGRGYMLQPMGDNGSMVRAWTGTSHAANDAPLINLLPFTQASSEPPENFELIYRSPWNNYLSIYRWRT